MRRILLLLPAALLLCVSSSGGPPAIPFVTARVAAAGGTFKVAFWNVQSGKGEAPLPGRTCSFEENSNCTDPSKPLNAWGTGFFQDELIRAVGNDPSIVALGLAEAWTCGSPENIRRALGWAARSADMNGVAIVVRHGFAGPLQWKQLDTSANQNPKDSMWVMRAPVCLDAGCTAAIDVYTAHWYTDSDKIWLYEIQAQETIDFMAAVSGTRPHILIGDLNVWEEPGWVCSQEPKPVPVAMLRHAGYTDAWRFVHGSAEGFTGMLNRVRCGVPEGYVWKRIDYSWSRGIQPLSMRRFGLVTPGECAASDHLGIVAEYPYPGGAPLPDTAPPEVSILAPASGAQVSGHQKVSIRATDNVGVARVDLLIDGTLASRLTAAPYEYVWNTLAVPDGVHTLEARAFDPSGNSASSGLRSVQVSNPPASSREVVLYAADSALLAGGWRIQPDAAAAGGAFLWHPDAGAPKRDAPLAAPAHYFELTFDAEAGIPYRLWLRGRAERDHWSNDSVFAQFSGSVTSAGAAAFRIGTTAGTTVNLEDCSGCGLAGWGWQDNGWGVGVLGPPIHFAATGRQTVRIQTREDGLMIDQVVVSPERYLTLAPGALKRDATILPRSGGGTVPVAPADGWTGRDIGSVALAGSSGASAGTVTLRASGADIWHAADGFHFWSRRLSGDVEILARVAALQAADPWAKAGVMIRETSAAGSRHASLFATPGRGVAFQRRLATGGASTHTAAGSGVAPQWVRLVRIGSSLSAYRSATGADWSLVGSDQIGMARDVDVGLALTSHDNAALAQAGFDGLAWRQLLPAGWSSRDIGATVPAGGAFHSAGTFGVRGAGADIWGTADGFHFLYRAWTGDGDIVARVTGLEPTHAWAKAGVMFRESLTAGSRHAFMLVSAGKGTAFQRRTSTSGISTHTGGTAAGAPRWVRLVRRGQTVTAYESADGSSWAAVGSDTVSMGATVYVGLAVTSHSDGRPAAATFDRVAIR